MEYKLRAPLIEEYTPLEQILTNRGIKYEDIEHYLNPNEEDDLSPLLLDNIKQAAQILCKHIADEKGHVHVQVDCDADGIFSSSLLLNYIYKRFPSAIGKFSYSCHDGKIHGIDMEAVPPWTTLVVAPDASSNEYDFHEELANNGIDVLVLDHHVAERVSEFACVVNNQLCDYPTKSLCGTGIVYKLCEYIDSIMGNDIASKFLDILATATVGDMMDQRDFETHYFTQLGLTRLRNPFIKGMAEKNAYSIGDTLTPIGVAFYIVPLVNAIMRVGTMEEKKLLFESTLEWKAHELIPSTKRGCAGQQEERITQSLRTCTNVKNRQTKEQDKAVEQIQELVEKNNLLQHKVLLVQLDTLTFDRSIVGLVANKLMAQYQRPTCILVRGEQDREVVWSGSARACGVDDFRSFCEDSGLVVFAQGHALAHGLAILDSNIKSFIDLCDKEFADKDFSPSYKVDFIYSAGEIKPKDVLDIGDMKSLWGQNLEEPLLAIENISVTKSMLQLMSRDKNPTLKITLPNSISCIKFKSSEEEYERLYSESGCVTITIVGRCEVNRYLGRVIPQIIVEDYQIIGKQDYYF